MISEIRRVALAGWIYVDTCNPPSRVSNPPNKNTDAGGGGVSFISFFLRSLCWNPFQKKSIQCGGWVEEEEEEVRSMQ